MWWPGRGTNQEEEIFSGFVPDPIDLVKRSEPNTQLPLDESIGEIICNRCNGWGNLYSENEKHVAPCNKCWGDGKLDWIEKAVGKKQTLWGSASTSGYAIVGPLHVIK